VRAHGHVAGREKVEWNAEGVEATSRDRARRVARAREMNLWNPDICEIAFCTGSFALRGEVSIR